MFGVVGRGQAKYTRAGTLVQLVPVSCPCSLRSFRLEPQGHIMSQQEESEKSIRSKSDHSRLKLGPGMEQTDLPTA